MSNNKCRWVTCLQPSGGFHCQSRGGKPSMGANASITAGLTSSHTPHLSSQITRTHFVPNCGWVQVSCWSPLVWESVGNQGYMSWFTLVHTDADAHICTSVLCMCVCVCTLPSHMLSLLTLFNLEFNQICAKTGGPVRCGSSSSPQTSLPDVHYGSCLSAATTSLLISLSVSSLPVFIMLHHSLSNFFPVVFIYVNKRTPLHMTNFSDKAEWSPPSS